MSVRVSVCGVYVSDLLGGGNKNQQITRQILDKRKSVFNLIEDSSLCFASSTLIKLAPGVDKGLFHLFDDERSCRSRSGFFFPLLVVRNMLLLLGHD